MELFTTLQLPYLKAILGGTVRVATLDGDADLCVPPGELKSERLYPTSSHGLLQCSELLAK